VRRRIILLDDETEFALWKAGRQADTSALRRVLVGHKDRAIAESLSLLISLRGYETLEATDLTRVRMCLRSWKPDAFLMDTRLDSRSNYPFAREIRAETTTSNILMLAMSNICPFDPIHAMREAGFDGHCRRPCSLWRIIELVESYFKASVHGAVGRTNR
jgi:DNA-binding response OmpR family regulator